MTITKKKVTAKIQIKQVCERIPFYEKGTHNMGESFFLNIRKGDTPKNNSFAKHAVMLCDMVVPPGKTKKTRTWASPEKTI